MTETSEPVHGCFHPLIRSEPKMVLRGSFSKAKKLVHEALVTFKSFLSGGYERLPKTPPFSILSCTRGDSKLQRSLGQLDSFYHELKEDNKGKEKLPMRRYESLSEGDELYNGSILKFGKVVNWGARQAQAPPTMEDEDEKRDSNVKREGQKRRDQLASSHSRRIQLCLAMVKRLKEIEQMDKSNVEHVIDIEEVLHYYSRITCPSYIDMFNKFFMEVYAGFLAQSQPTGTSNSHSILNQMCVLTAKS